MSVESLIQLCTQCGIKLALSADGSDRLVVDAPKGALTPSLREALAAQKPELIAALKAQAREDSQTYADFQSETHVPATPTPPAARKMTSEQQLFSLPTLFDRADGEVKKLLAGRSYEAQVIETSDKATRQFIAAELLS